jgi:hypothetical protein
MFAAAFPELEIGNDFSACPGEPAGARQRPVVKDGKRWVKLAPRFSGVVKAARRESRFNGLPDAGKTVETVGWPIRPLPPG